MRSPSKSTTMSLSEIIFFVSITDCIPLCGIYRGAVCPAAQRPCYRPAKGLLHHPIRKGGYSGTSRRQISPQALRRAEGKALSPALLPPAAVCQMRIRHIALYYGAMFTLCQCFFRKICAKFSVFPLFPVLFRIFSGRVFRFSFNFSCFLAFSPVFSVFIKNRARGARSGANGARSGTNGARLPARKARPGPYPLAGLCPGPLPSRAGRGFARRIFRRRPSVRGPFGPPCAYSAVPVWGMCSRRMSTPSCASSRALAARPPA